MVDDTHFAMTSDWTAIAIMGAGLILFATTAADLSASMFGRRVTSGLVKRLRADSHDGISARSPAGAIVGLLLVAASQVVPLVGLIEGQKAHREPLFVAGLAEVLAALAVILLVVRGTKADTSPDADARQVKGNRMPGRRVLNWLSFMVVVAIAWAAMSYLLNR